MQLRARSKPLIDNKHYSLTSGADLEHYCSRFFSLHQLNFFQFARVYKNDTIAVLQTNQAWTSYWANHHFPILSSVKSEIMDDHHYSFLWDTSLPEGPRNIARTHYNIANGLCFVFRHVDYYELIAFGTPHDRQNAVDYYFNHYQVFLEFIVQLRVQRSDFIINAEKNRIALTEGMHDKNKDTLLKNPKEKHLTPKELLCLQLLKRGYSIKGTGDVLNLSPRTVETYLNRIKNRFELNCKYQLLQLVR